MSGNDVAEDEEQYALLTFFPVLIISPVSKEMLSDSSFPPFHRKMAIGKVGV